MQVDLQSPSFKAMRLPPSSKRARSPESPGDRPSKRLTLSIDRFAHAGNVTPQSSAGSSRFPSEDWVHQANGLTIDSPITVGSSLKEDRDEDMNMDEPTLGLQRAPQRPDLAPIQTMSFAQTTLYRQQHSHHHQGQNTPTSAPTPPGPIVTILPPTPAIPSQSIAFLGGASTRPSTPTIEEGSGTMMMLSSPLSSFASAAANITSPRKQRFTMGPRSDCVRCQLGVKGHAVHY